MQDDDGFAYTKAQMRYFIGNGCCAARWLDWDVVEAVVCWSRDRYRRNSRRSPRVLHRLCCRRRRRSITFETEDYSRACDYIFRRNRPRLSSLDTNEQILDSV